MPLYEYECLKCGERFEVIQKFSDEPFTVHSANGASTCSGAVRKLLCAPAIQFKGTGWYVTDYGKGGKKPPREKGESASDKASKPSKKEAKVATRSGGSKSKTRASAAA